MPDTHYTVTHTKKQYRIHCKDTGRVIPDAGHNPDENFSQSNDKNDFFLFNRCKYFFSRNKTKYSLIQTLKRGLPVENCCQDPDQKKISNCQIQTLII